MTRRLEPSQILLLLAAFLTPIMGGHVMVDAGVLPDGLMSSIGTLFGGPNAPFLSHALLALLVGGSLIATMLSRRVVQVPTNTLAVTIFIFAGAICATVIVSSFKAFSIPLAMEWASYGVGFFAVVGCIGRRMGPLALVAAFVAGVTIVAILGIQDYGQMRAIDPTWRISPLWNNPNAVGVIFLCGFMLALGLLLMEDRRIAFFGGLAAIVIFLATLLTQSKGAVLLIPVGLVALALFIFVPKTTVQRKQGLARLGGVLLVALLLAFLAQKSSTAAGNANGGSLSHLTNSGGSSEQSAGFRMLLWKTSAELIKHDPVGTGIGTFRYNSAKPGLATQTVFGHSVYLQLATEGSLLIPLILIVAALMWARLVFRGAKSLPPQSRALLGSVFAAVLVVLLHSWIDSDLYYYGTGLAVFMLMGVGMLLSTDSVAPEFLFPVIRRAAAGITAGVVLLLFYFGYTDVVRAEARGALQGGKPDVALATVDSLHSIAPTDGEAWYITAQASPDRQSQLAAAQKAVEFAPSTRNLRLLTRLQLMTGDLPAAMGNLNRAVGQDPNGLSTLTLAAEVRKANGDTQGYIDALKKLVAVENTSYFRVRSLPELVPTETYDARLILADATPSITPDERRKLLGEAVAGYREYLRMTVPNVQRTIQSDPTANFGGEDMGKVKEKMTRAADAAHRLAELDRSAGDSEGAAKADEDAAAFLGANK